MSSILDASNKLSIEDWTKRTIDHFGGVDLLVVNAGGPPPGKFMEFTDENWQAAFDMNLMSAVRMIREVIPSMESRGGGSILTVTSSSVKEPIDVLILSNVMRSGGNKPRKEFIATASSQKYSRKQPNARTN